ncbi:PhoP/PhoQ regulator MgrB [Rahnella sp. SAP-1]|uniref:PhoP/PhoQ regulator MgrB n=1 Tax=Rouxiella aceris TaxID=2703884 RepID=A0A848MGY3_9GAMM|nr:PhoP/PhoQ regulator MgrB [Rouxiella aceris]NMP26925.1 PhoP/PhoQ regulator MgrB [Rouxiella aceris]
MGSYFHTCRTQILGIEKRVITLKRSAIKLKKPVFTIKKIIVFIVFLTLCVGLYLLALNSYCDQGGNFDLGICSVTSFIPW